MRRNREFHFVFSGMAGFVETVTVPDSLEGRIPYAFSGVRPSPGAATLGYDLAFEPFSARLRRGFGGQALENAELAVAEDRHTPLNRYR